MVQNAELVKQQSRAAFLRHRAAQILREKGFSNIHFEYPIKKRLARIDVFGYNETENKPVFLEIKEIINNPHHHILHAAGQLLFYKDLEPAADLYVAIPTGIGKISEELLLFLEKYQISLLQIEYPPSLRPRKVPFLDVGGTIINTQYSIRGGQF